MKLTDENLHLCVLPDGKSEKLYADDDLPGFGIRVRKDAKGRVRRKWFYQYRAKADGSQHRLNLGNVDKPAPVAATKARQDAAAKAERVQRGGTPQKERKDARAGRKRLLLDEAINDAQRSQLLALLRIARRTRRPRKHVGSRSPNLYAHG
jgi:hypothetical protein